MMLMCPAQRDWFRDRDVIQSKVLNPKEISQVVFCCHHLRDWMEVWLCDGLSRQHREQNQYTKAKLSNKSAAWVPVVLAIAYLTAWANKFPFIG